MEKNRELSYYEDYIAEKITYYVGIVTSILLIFLYYKIRQMKIVISLSFFLNAITWLIYLAINEKRVYILILVRAIQRVFLTVFQASHCIYLMHFAQPESKYFIGSLVVASMYVGLLFINVLFYFCDWRATVMICAFESLICSGLIWMVPEMIIKPKSLSKVQIYDRNNRNSLFVMIFVMALQQLSGIGIFLGHLSQILTRIGLSIDVQLQSCIFAFVCFLSTLVSALISDYVGIRFMWSISAFGLCIGLAVFGATLIVDLSESVATIGIFIFFLFYSLVEGPIPWCLCGTLFQEEIRIESAAINVLENFFFFPILHVMWNGLDKKIGQLGSIIFSFVICFLAIFCGFVVPQLDMNYDDSVNVI